MKIVKLWTDRISLWFYQPSLCACVFCLHGFFNPKYEYFICQHPKRAAGERRGESRNIDIRPHGRKYSNWCQRTNTHRLAYPSSPCIYSNWLHKWGLSLGKNDCINIQLDLRPIYVNVFWNSVSCFCSTGFLYFYNASVESNYCVRVHSRRLHRQSTTPHFPFYGVPNHLCDHSAGKSRNDCTDSSQFPSTNTNVFFSQQLVLLRSLLFHCHCPPNSDKFLVREQSHFIYRLCCPVLFLCCICHCWVSSTSCHGLWPLCSHLQPTPVSSCHVQESVCGTSDGFIPGRMCQWHDTHKHYLPSSFLQLQCHWSLLLWRALNTEPGLF